MSIKPSTGSINTTNCELVDIRTELGHAESQNSNPIQSPKSVKDDALLQYNGGLTEANEAIFSLLGVVGGIILGAQVSWLQVTIGFTNQDSTGVQVSSAFGIIGVIFSTIGTAGSLLTSRWFRLLGPEERQYLHQRWDAWMRRTHGDINAKEPDPPQLYINPRQKREDIVALTLLIPILWVLGGSACFLASLTIFTFATQPHASAIFALVSLTVSATFLPFYFVGHSTARVCSKLYIKRKQL
ncbi:hypothetical protein K435DRAFT_877631 [Dendrothele bispora CBS 962.96]|uniref:Uncharacterized protein n=1 Tax=Dendrothele bispora (strain CBS 962.96) TaxID=1314807 RepID=A0A4S8KQK2_DENBC|nr:hypothetical protein K435DRAFT_877631 [Dendrothele bispora CBS 962.96]